MNLATSKYNLWFCNEKKEAVPQKAASFLFYHTIQVYLSRYIPSVVFIFKNQCVINKWLIPK